MQANPQSIVSRLGLGLVLCLFVISPALAGEATVAPGKKVTIQFSVATEDGTIQHQVGPNDPPFTFVVGGDDLIQGLQDALIGMKVGEKKKVTLQPKDAFGPHDPKMVAKVPRAHLPPKPEPRVGMRLRVTAPDGGSRPAVITQVNSDSVLLDMNHPLAGKVLVIEVQVMDIA